MTDLRRLATHRLLERLRIIRQRFAMNHLYDEWDDKQYDEDQKSMEIIKSILALREHYPRGAKGRQLRQKAKQNR